MFLIFLPFLNAAQLGDKERQEQKAKDQVKINKVMEMKDSSSQTIKYYLQVVEDKNDLNIKNSIYKTRNIIGLSTSPSQTNENLIMYVDMKNLNYITFHDYTKFDTTFKNKGKIQCETNNIESNPKECKSTFFTFTAEDSVLQNTKDVLFSLGTSLLKKGLTNVVSFDKKLFAQVIIDNEDVIKNLLFQEVKKAILSHSKLQGQKIISLNNQIDDNAKINSQLQESLKSQKENVQKLTEEIKRTKKEYLDLQKKYNSLKSKLSSEKKNNTLVKQLNDKIASLNTKQQVLQKQYQASQELKDKLMNTNIEINEENKKLYKQLNELKQQNQNLKNENKLVQDESNNIKNTTPDQAIISVVEKNNVLKEKVVLLEKENNKLVDEKMSLQKKLDSVSGPTVQQTEELEKLREQINQKSKSTEKSMIEVEKLKKINQELIEEITILKNNVFDSK